MRTYLLCDVEAENDKMKEFVVFFLRLLARMFGAVFS
jgi:hypothetical protein